MQLILFWNISWIFGQSYLQLNGIQYDTIMVLEGRSYLLVKVVTKQHVVIPIYIIYYIYIYTYKFITDLQLSRGCRTIANLLVKPVRDSTHTLPTEQVSFPKTNRSVFSLWPCSTDSWINHCHSPWLHRLDDAGQEWRDHISHSVFLTTEAP